MVQCAWLHWVDRTFSTFRDDSEISRIERGTLATDDATSGTYERGDHLWGRSRREGAGLASVTVVGPELGTADALATAVFVEGTGEPRWFDRFPDYDRLVITESGRIRWTSGLDDMLAPPASNPVTRSDRR